MRTQDWGIFLTVLGVASVALPGALAGEPSGGGKLTIALLPTFGSRWLIPRLGDFTSRHPDIQLDLVTQVRPFDFIRRTDGLIEPEFIKTGIVEIPAGDQVLDEIMVFDRVLTEQEIRALYQANAPERR